MLSSLLCLAALAPLSLAAVHTVFVGGLKVDGSPNLVFTPNQIQAAVGDTVSFTFLQKNHTVTQSSFAKPCEFLTDAYGNHIGFNSGFKPVSPSTQYNPTFDVIVNDTQPIWAFCQQINPPNPTHCQSGMVIGINAPASGNTFDKFLAAAKASTEQNSAVSSVVAQTTETITDFKTETETATITATKTVTVDATSVFWPNAPSIALVPATHTIIVGGDPTATGFVYTPSNITANVGDHVEFSFRVKNHTVTQSSFLDPCRKIGDTTPVQGLDSGFNPVAADATVFPSFSFVVNDTNPIWGYCRQHAANFSHCGVGMVFSVNANPFSPTSFAAFQQIAVNTNGSGFVDPFANRTPIRPGSGSASQFISVPTVGGNPPQVLDALGADDSSSSAKLSKLLDTYAPAALGLLGAVLVLVITLVIISVMLFRRSSAASTPARILPQTYRPVPVAMPSSKMQEDGSYGYEEPLYSDRTHDA